jgi:hypothetical protein
MIFSKKFQNNSLCQLTPAQSPLKFGLSVLSSP